MDHYQTRFPTNVLDIASFFVRLAKKAQKRLVAPRDTLLGRGALHKVRDLSHVRSHSGPSPRTHHT